MLSLGNAVLFFSKTCLTRPLGETVRFICSKENMKNKSGREVEKWKQLMFAD